MSNPLVTNSTLKLKLKTGINAKGDDTFSTKSFGDINPGLTDDEFLGVADGMAGLQSHALAEVGRVDTSILTA